MPASSAPPAFAGRHPMRPLPFDPARLRGLSERMILDYSFQTGDVRMYGSGNHTQSLAFGQPLLVLDMYEHSYHIDYGAAAARCVDAFFTNINWDEVNHRFERARRAAGAFAA